MTAMLSRLRILVGVETVKAVRGKTLRVGLLAAAFGTLLFAWGVDRSQYQSAWTTTALSFRAGLWVAEIFLLVAGATAIAGETAQGTLKMILPHAYSRTDWIVAKAVVLALQAVAFLLVVALCAVGFGMASGGLGDVVRVDDSGIGRGTETLYSAAEMQGYFTQAVTAALAALVATAWLGLLVSCVFDALVPALSTAFLLVLGAKSAGTVFGASEAVTSKVYATHPVEMLGQMAKLDDTYNTAVWSTEALPAALRLAAIVAAVSVVLSLAVFSRRDLHS
jgi:ABC-type transport system involved in multi-copper enzyme maturation permease subunit